MIALKNADSLLKDVLKAVDTNGDGHIEYSGTRVPVALRDSNATLTQSRIPEICGTDGEGALATL